MTYVSSEVMGGSALKLSDGYKRLQIFLLACFVEGPNHAIKENKRNSSKLSL